MLCVARSSVSVLSPCNPVGRQLLSLSCALHPVVWWSCVCVCVQGRDGLVEDVLQADEDLCGGVPRGGRGGLHPPGRHGRVQEARAPDPGPGLARPQVLALGRAVHQDWCVWVWVLAGAPGGWCCGRLGWHARCLPGAPCINSPRYWHSPARLPHLPPLWKRVQAKTSPPTRTSRCSS